MSEHNIIGYSSKVPKNRLVYIKSIDEDGSGDEGDVVNANLYFDGRVSFDCSSDFGQIWDSNDNELLTLLSSSSSAFSSLSGQFALQGFQIWKSTKPLSFNFDVKLYMETSGKTDVVIPALTLAELCLPKINTEGSGGGVKIGNLHMDTLIPPGPNLQVLWDSLKHNEGGKNTKGRIFNIELGKFKIPSCVITKAEPKFSEQMDEDGCPISAEVSIEASTLQVATTDMIEKIKSNF